MKKITLLFCISILLLTCKKSPTEETEKPVVKQPETPVDNSIYTSNNQYNLNVIYFIPADNPEKPDYVKRLSEILLHAQDYYGKQMELNGYGYKTFGLLVNAAKQVKIITIKGKLNSTEYTDDSNMLKEVNQYFGKNSHDNTGNHYLITFPALPNGLSNPYYGGDYGCFWPDKGYDLKSLPTIELGGFMHELGHGLNLPHNKERESRINDPNYGTALMGAGNGTYGVKPTFLTEADCAILNTNEAFQVKSSIEYYRTVIVNMHTIKASYSAEKNAILVSGAFTSSIPVTSVLYYLDPNYDNEGTGANRDYNAISWASKVIGKNEFSIELPLSEMNQKFRQNNPAELKIKLVHENGKITSKTLDFNFVNGKPDISVDFYEAPDFDKSKWKIVSVSSEEPTNEAKKLIDTYLSTFWYARTSKPEAVLPHNIVVDMGEELKANGFSINQRQDVYRMVKDIEFLVSSDNINWESTGSYVVPNNKNKNRLKFTNEKTFRYFKIVIKSNYDTVEPNKSCIAEVGVF